MYLYQLHQRSLQGRHIVTYYLCPDLTDTPANPLSLSQLGYVTAQEETLHHHTFLYWFAAAEPWCLKRLPLTVADALDEIPVWRRLRPQDVPAAIRRGSPGCLRLPWWQRTMSEWRYSTPSPDIFHGMAEVFAPILLTLPPPPPTCQQRLACWLTHCRQRVASGWQGLRIRRKPRRRHNYYR